MIKRLQKDKKALSIALTIASVYFLFYLWSIQNIVFDSFGHIMQFEFASDWISLIFRQRVALLWEPIGVWHIFDGLSIFIAPLNIVLALILSVLVYMNILVAVYTYRMGSVCNIRPKFHGIIGFLPAFLTGFACCAPTFIIAFAAAFSSITTLFIAIRPWLIPASILIMIFGYWYSANRIKPGQMETYERSL